LLSAKEHPELRQLVLPDKIFCRFHAHLSQSLSPTIEAGEHAPDAADLNRAVFDSDGAQNNPGVSNQRIVFHYNYMAQLRQPLESEDVGLAGIVVTPRKAEMIGRRVTVGDSNFNPMLLHERLIHPPCQNPVRLPV
jgi:hypothetical protein